MHQSINQPINRPFNHPPIQAINQSINQIKSNQIKSNQIKSNQSINQSINQTNKQIIHPPPPPPPHRHQPSSINHHFTVSWSPHPHSPSSSSSSSTSPSSSSSVNQSITQSCQHKSIQSQKLLKTKFLSFSKPRCMSCESIDFHRCWGWLQRIQCLQITRSGHWKKTHLGFPANNWASHLFQIKELSAEKSFQVKWFKVFEVTEKHGLWYKYVKESCFKSQASRHLKMFVLTRFHRKSYHRHPCPNTRSRPGGNISTSDRLTWLNSQILMPSFLPQHSIHLRNTEHNLFVSKYDLIILW